MTTSPRYELYSFWRTSATYRVRVACRLKGISPLEHYINIDTGEQRSAAFLKINPMAAIPAFIDNSEATGSRPWAPITQSMAILEFLEESQPSPALLPSDLHGRARVRSLALLLTADTHPLITPRVKKYLTANAHFDDAAWRAWQINWFTTGMQAIEQRLATEPQTGRYCHGDAISMADICLASILVVMRVFKIEVANIPNAMRIMGECEKHPAFIQSAPGLQVGAPVA